MLRSDIYRMTLILGRQKPEVAALIRKLERNPRYEGRVRQRLRRMCREKGIDPDNLPEFGLPDEINAGTLQLGRAKLGERLCQTAGLVLEDLSAHVGIFGQVRIGKSTLVKHIVAQAIRLNIPCLIFDVHGEWTDLLRVFGPEKILWLEPSNLGINVLEIPRIANGEYSMRPEQWVAKLKAVMRGSLFFKDLSSNLTGQLLLKLYEKQNVLEPGSQFPSLSQLLEAVEQAQFRSDDRRRLAKDTLSDRFTMLIQHLGKGIDVVKSRNIHKLWSKSIVLDFSKIEEIPKLFLFDYLLALLRASFPQVTGAQPRLIVVEESHALLTRDVENRYDLGEAPGPSFLRSARKIGGDTGVIVVDQVPSLLSPAVLANLASIVCFRLSHGSCQRAMSDALALDRYQRQELAKLPAREAVVKVNRVAEPWLLAIDELSFPEPLSSEEAREICEPLLREIPFVRKKVKQPELWDDTTKDSQQKDSQDELSGDELRVFRQIAQRPWEVIEDRMDALGLDRDSEGLARRKLKGRGFIQFAGKVGSRYRLFELTPRGREYSKSINLKVASTGKGSTAHEAIVEYTEKSLGRHSSRFRFQRSGLSVTTKGRQPDSLLILSTGDRVPIQAMYRNNPDKEANALLDLCELAQKGPDSAENVDFVLAVAVNKAHLQAVCRALKRQNNGQIPSQLELLDFDSVIATNFDWTEILDRPI